LSAWWELDLIAQVFEASHPTLLDALPIPLIKEIAPQIPIGYPITHDMIDDHQNAMGHP
jgi:hypothetical protein